MARPSSKASTESRPRPSPNSAMSGSISSGLMSSRPRASIIRFLISSCRSLIFGELLNKVLVQVFIEFARRNGRRAVSGKLLRVDILANAHFKVKAPRRNAVPRLGLGQGGGGDADHHRRHHAGTAQGNGRRATVKLRR